jgi:7,8-dihydroneopterin aldolase/epimerase/oxygenase
VIHAMNIIRLNNIRVYAYHGCWEEEAIVGGEYVVDVALYGDFTNAALIDDLSQTVDYVQVKELVYQQMAIRAKLIETVAFRIHSLLKDEFRWCEKVWVRITKLNAPMGGQVESVSVEIEN